MISLVHLNCKPARGSIIFEIFFQGISDFLVSLYSQMILFHEQI
jgi:hypothetical protein